VGDLATLAQEYLISRGALVERYDEADSSLVEALLAPELSQALNLGEHVVLAEGATRPGAARLAYGTELLERFVTGACHLTPLAFAMLEEPLSSGHNVADIAIKKMTGLNCVLRSVDAGCKEGWVGYLVVDYRYAANADERREGLVRVVINEETGAHIAALRDLDNHPALRPGLDGALPTLETDAVLARAANAARREARAAIESFGSSVVRRHLRDRARLRAYFSALENEMRGQLERLRARGAGADELTARQSKLAGIAPELERKLRDLALRYVLRVELSPIAALRVGIAVRRSSLKLLRKQAERTLTVHYCAATRAVDPLACEACGASIYSFAACDTKLHLLCAACDAARPSSRHCPVCEQKGTRSRG
jgi:hypothetical protein